jgi:hypothetical protein
MRASLQDAAGLQHGDRVTVAHRGQAVRHDQRRAAGHEWNQSCLGSAKHAGFAMLLLLLDTEESVHVCLSVSHLSACRW